MAAALTPSVTWAQRNNLVFLSINVPDVASPEIKVPITMHLKPDLFNTPESADNLIHLKCLINL